MKVLLRLVKGSRQQQSAGKRSSSREQRFRFGAEEVWEVSCRAPRRRVNPDQPRKVS